MKTSFAYSRRKKLTAENAEVAENNFFQKKSLRPPRTLRFRNKVFGGRKLHVAFFIFHFSFILASCTLFEPRDAEPPNQSGASYLPRTFPTNVIENLKTAVAYKDPVGYIACFSDSSRTRNAYTFIPSADATTVYAAVLRNWTYQQEESYFRNLVAKKQANGFSQLTLTPRDSTIGSNERVYSYDYTFSFEHTESPFSQGARGSLQFTLGNANSEWTITRWVDSKTTDMITWSSFKGKFSN
jgi:hypothetical protein